MPVLPQEIWDLIISLCEHDSFPSCSLVCRAWVTSSRFQQFETRKLRPVVISPSSLPDILNLVDSSTSTISPYINRLVLKDWGPSSESSSSTFHAQLPRITGRMSVIESLTFDSTNWEDMMDGALKFLVFNFRDTLKTLELRDCPCRSFDSLVDLICSFPALDKLTLYRIVRLGPKGERRDSRPLGLLRSVQVHGFIKQELFRWLRAAKCLDMEEVSLGPLFPGEAPVVGKFLKALKDNLKRLTLSGESAPHLHRAIDLKHNTHLTSVHFTNLHVNRPGNQPTDASDWFIQLLLAIRSTQLQNLQFSLWVYSTVSVDALQHFPWFSLRTCLERPQFVCITSVKFSFHMVTEGGRARWPWRSDYMRIGEGFIR
ncbi:hypothetical protein FB45DRAFT_1001859, partial [Roridomyces roridus]